jgi:hypothetical protein
MNNKARFEINPFTIAIYFIICAFVFNIIEFPIPDLSTGVVENNVSISKPIDTSQKVERTSEGFFYGLFLLSLIIIYVYVKFKEMKGGNKNERISKKRNKSSKDDKQYSRPTDNNPSFGRNFLYYSCW